MRPAAEPQVFVRLPHSGLLLAVYLRPDLVRMECELARLSRVVQQRVRLELIRSGSVGTFQTWRAALGWLDRYACERSRT